jgi:acetyl-CoA carboxylase alpha subunit
VSEQATRHFLAKGLAPEHKFKAVTNFAEPHTFVNQRDPAAASERSNSKSLDLLQLKAQRDRTKGFRNLSEAYRECLACHPYRREIGDYYYKAIADSGQRSYVNDQHLTDSRALARHMVLVRQHREEILLASS